MEAALRELHCAIHLDMKFKGEIGNNFSLDQGEADCENHWDKFLETPVAQAAIKAEIQAFFDVHEQCGTHAGGIHLEMTGKDVTECVGGDMNAVTVDGPRGLDTKYLTHCDPRLNSAQALEIAFMVAERLRGQAGLPAMLD